MNKQMILKDKIARLELIIQELKTHNSEDYKLSIEINTDLIRILSGVEWEIQNSLKSLTRSIELINNYCPSNLDDFRGAIIEIFSELDCETKKISSPN